MLSGTDAIWFGSPQDQIRAFRAFEITPDFQERQVSAIHPSVGDIGKTL
jgi:hypothetical protein